MNGRYEISTVKSDVYVTDVNTGNSCFELLRGEDGDFWFKLQSDVHNPEEADDQYDFLHSPISRSDTELYEIIKNFYQEFRMFLDAYNSSGKLDKSKVEEIRKMAILKIDNENQFDIAYPSSMYEREPIYYKGNRLIFDKLNGFEIVLCENLDFQIVPILTNNSISVMHVRAPFASGGGTNWFYFRIYDLYIKLKEKVL